MYIYYNIHIITKVKSSTLFANFIKILEENKNCLLSVEN